MDCKRIFFQHKYTQYTHNTLPPVAHSLKLHYNVQSLTVQLHSDS